MLRHHLQLIKTVHVVVFLSLNCHYRRDGVLERNFEFRFCDVVLSVRSSSTCRFPQLEQPNARKKLLTSCQSLWLKLASIQIQMPPPKHLAMSEFHFATCVKGSKLHVA